MDTRSGKCRKKCGKGLRFNVFKKTCVCKGRHETLEKGKCVCKPGFPFDKKAGKCHKPCPAGQRFSAKRERCVMKKCPEDHFRFSKSKKRCVCKKGYKLNESVCEKVHKP